MTCQFSNIALCFAGVILPAILSQPAAGATIASCNASFTMCGVPENISLKLPFTAIAGDVVLTDPNSTTVSDVFRIFNNLINTGQGTGLGNMVFLYSVDDTALPAPSTYSANAVFITESTSGFTHFVGNGTDYLLGVPEPRTFGFVVLGLAAIFALSRRPHRTVDGV
jgi:hypothetical protein